ncbi:MAG: transglutaminase family protein [Tepidisphaeraceae bacterium]
MAIRVALHHLTRYKYSRDVWLSPHTVRLRPAPHCRTPILSYSMKIKPAGHFVNWQQDPYSNRLGRLVFPKKTREFSVEIDLVAEMTVINPFDFFLEAAAETFPFHYDPNLKKELAPYFETLPAGECLQKLIDEVRTDEARTIDYMVTLNQAVQNRVGYTIRLEPGIQTPEETLTKATGSCRDSAWLLVQLMRHLGLAARFCSGYLIQLAPDVKSLDGPSGTDVDFTDLHAWTEVYLPAPAGSV